MGIHVLRKYALFIGVAALGALATSCGGDDTGTATPTPTSTSTATPTPTPTQSQVDFDFDQDFATQSTNANYVFAFFTPDSGGDETFNAAARLNGNATITYTASSDTATFGFVDLSDDVTFAASELVSSSATERTYQSGDEQLVIELPFDHVLRVSYESQSDFTRGTTEGTLRGQRVALFFNPVTTTDDITADIAYSGALSVFGGDPENTAPDVISSPTTTFTVDASAEQVTGTIEVYEDVNGTATLVAGFDVDAALNDNGTFSATVEDTTNNFEGSLAGSLTGPDREELFLLFSVSGNADADDDRRFVGSYIGDAS